MTASTRSPMPTPEYAACASCAAAQHSGLVREGAPTGNWDFLVALAGNPNTGKSTVFNALTGLRQHTGNWPGKTVTLGEGAFRYDGKRYRLVDLPGTYSLLSTSMDEEVARDFLLFAQPSVTIVVVDATRLERNLNLALQVLEITAHVVLALNLIDEAARHGIKVDERALARELGVPVVPMVARQGRGVSELLATVHEVAQGKYPLRPHWIRHHDAALEGALKQLTDQLQAMFPGLPNARWVALRLLEDDASITQLVRTGALAKLARRDMPAALASMP